ncbi:MAG: hypothetical protein GXP49_11930 [Deltaproteobacteria bacterium]|nr:hypothetical protein [Deltaproteobacteria bacterium]
MELIIPEKEKRKDAILRHPHPELFQGMDDEQADRIYRFFFYTPSRIPARGTVVSSLKTRVLKLRNGSDRKKPWNMELVIEPYIGCTHACLYCPVKSRLKPGEEPRPFTGRSGRADGFARSLRQDLRDLEFLAPPPMPVFMSLESDPLQTGLEEKVGVTERTLKDLAARKDRFSRITIRTKNPKALLLENKTYLDSLDSFDEVVIELNASFGSEELRRAWEPGAPVIEDRFDALQRLKEHGFDVILRIEPLLPLEPLSVLWFKHKTYEKLGCPLSGPRSNDMEALLNMAAKYGCNEVALVPAYLPCGHGAKSVQRKVLAPLFRRRDGKFLQQAGAFRLPREYLDTRLLPAIEKIADRNEIRVVRTIDDR